MSAPLALYVTHRESSIGADAYQHLTARIVSLAEDGTPRNIPTADRYADDRAHAGIAATAQADRGSHSYAGDPPEYSYGWRFGLSTDTDPMDSETVAAVLGTLRKAGRAMARAEAQYGPARTFGQYLARIATALDVPILTGQAGSDGLYSSGTFARWTAGDAVSVVDGWTAAFRRKDNAA